MARRIRPHTIRAGALERLYRFGRPGFDGPAPGQERCRRETQCAGKRVSLRFDPYLNARAESLSVGVKKRVVIARSLVNQPRLILADSPLEGLDDQAQEEFLYICTKLSQVGYPIVMTSSYMLPFEIAALRCVELAGEKK